MTVVKHLSILGSTGSIGVNTLDVVSRFPDRFNVIGLAAGTNLKVLKEQIQSFKPKIVSVLTDSLALELKKSLPSGYKPEIVYGSAGITLVAGLKKTDMVVSALVGSAGLLTTFTAIRKGKHIAIDKK